MPRTQQQRARVALALAVLAASALLASALNGGLQGSATLQPCVSYGNCVPKYKVRAKELRNVPPRNHLMAGRFLPPGDPAGTPRWRAPAARRSHAARPGCGARARTLVPRGRYQSGWRMYPFATSNTRATPRRAPPQLTSPPLFGFIPDPSTTNQPALQSVASIKGGSGLANAPTAATPGDCRGYVSPYVGCVTSATNTYTLNGQSVTYPPSCTTTQGWQVTVMGTVTAIWRAVAAARTPPVSDAQHARAPRPRIRGPVPPTGSPRPRGAPPHAAKRPPTVPHPAG